MNWLNVADVVRVRNLPYSLPCLGLVGRIIGLFGPMVVVKFDNGHEEQYLNYELERVS